MEDMISFVRGQLACKLKGQVDGRIREFRQAGLDSSHGLFKELCFCILTANYSAAGGIRIQQEIGDGFLELPEPELANRLKKLGHRFPNARARYIVLARRHADSLKQRVSSFKDGMEAREWLAGNIPGLGYKEASHFLRNIGFEDLAIIDFHIIDILEKYGLIARPKTLTRKRYMQIEGVLRDISAKLGITLAELDLYLWCAETGKVLK